MKEAAYHVFDTPIGACGIAWTEADERVTTFQLPEASPDATAVRIARESGGRLADSLPPVIDALINRIDRHLTGAQLDDFLDVNLDLAGVGRFEREVYAVTREIPPGRTVTYGEIAKSLGQPGAARAVGQALGRNPIALIVPCHRVLAAGQQPGGFSAHGGRSTKARLLSIEGAILTLDL
jgi:methylated-DNA-[protein]-cysteine S-methyltransferase